MWPPIRDRWQQVRSHLDEFTGPAYVIAAMGSFCDDESARDIEQFFKAHPVRGAERTLQQALERIRSCSGLKRGQQAKLAEWLSRLR